MTPPSQTRTLEVTYLSSHFLQILLTKSRKIKHLPLTLILRIRRDRCKGLTTVPHPTSYTPGCYHHRKRTSKFFPFFHVNSKCFAVSKFSHFKIQRENTKSPGSWDNGFARVMCTLVGRNHPLPLSSLKHVLDAGQQLAGLPGAQGGAERGGLRGKVVESPSLWR